MPGRCHLVPAGKAISTTPMIRIFLCPRERYHMPLRCDPTLRASETNPLRMGIAPMTPSPKPSRPITADQNAIHIAVRAVGSELLKAHLILDHIPVRSNANS
jgi:hypothetical protein